MEDIKVSIICNTYNHVRYIRDALKGFVMQKTSFAFEVLVHDDASTDGTQEIIREYEKKYPEIIKPIYQQVNQYSQNIKITKTFQYPRAKGKYIAFCEGDDYWIDENKLQVQFNALEENPEIDICAHSYKVINGRDDSFIENKIYSKNDCIIPLERIIIGEGGIVGTNTLMYRKDIVMDDRYTFDKDICHDYVLQIKCSLRSGMLFLNRIMAVYRFAVPNSFCDRMRKDKEKEKVFLEKKIYMLKKLDEDTQLQYHNAIEARLLLYGIVVEKPFKEKIHIFKNHSKGFRLLNSHEKLQIVLKTFFPFAIKLKRIIYKDRRQKVLRDNAK